VSGSEKVIPKKEGDTVVPNGNFDKKKGDESLPEEEEIVGSEGSNDNASASGDKNQDTDVLNVDNMDSDDEPI